MRKKLLTVISIIVILFMNFLVSEIYADEEYGGSTESQTSVQYYNSNGTTSDVTFSAATNGFTRRGYSFVKWADGDEPTTLYAETQSIIYNPQYDSSTLVKIMFATWQANELTFENQTITKSYSTSQQTANVTAATNGTGLYIYTKKSGESDITVSPTGVITIPAGKTAGTYTIVVTATDSNSNMSKDATYTIKINPIPTTNTVTITGTPTFGQTLTANVETNSNGEKHYQWYYATSKDATSGTNITNATNATYTIANVGSTSMVGKYIGCKVTIDAGTNWNAHTGATATTQTAVAKATPTITFNPTATSAEINYNESKTFKAKSNVAGTLSATSASSTYVSITGGASNKATANTEYTITYKGARYRASATNITVKIVPTDTANWNEATKTFSVTKVNKLTVGAPSNLSVSTAGIVTWTAGTNSNAHEISIDNSTWTTATSGVNYLSTITAATGTRTVYVRAKNTDTTNYTTPSSNATKAVTVRTLTTSSNNTNYGTVDSSTYNVISGVTYTTSNNTLAVKSGTTTLKTITASPKTGHSFSSWSSASGTVSANTTVTATFTVNTYTIKFNGNGATSGSMSNLSMTYGTAKNLTANAFKKEGKGFAGWARSATATTATYTDEQQVNNLTTTNGATVNLYAVWADAELAAGDLFNVRIKKLAENTGTVNYFTTDTNITEFKKSSTKPTAANMTSNNLISASTSKVPIYAWFDNGTIYWWSEDATPLCNAVSSWMFYDCTSLTSVNVSNFNTANVTSMNEMFRGCSSLTNLDLSNFNTAKVTSMYSMFQGCSNLTNLDVSNFNTANVTSMNAMFTGCSSLTNLDLSNFNTANVTDMGGMFSYCSSLTNLDLSNFNTAKVTSMYSMFQGCSNLTSLNLSNFNTAKVTNMGDMFSGCTSLTSLDLSNFNTAQVTIMLDMFNGCSGLTSLNLSSFNTANVTDMRSMFYKCSSLTSLNLSSFNTANVTDMGNMFDWCSGLTSLDLSSFYTNQVTNMGLMFRACYALNTIYATDNFVTTNVTDGYGMFAFDSNLVGGNGTVYNGEHDDKEYARIDRANVPGYFTLKGVHKITLNNQSATSAGTQAIYETYGSQYSLSHGGTAATTITVPTRTGYTFGGYYTATGGGGTQCINASGTITALNTAFTGPTTLYAKWTANPLTFANQTITKDYSTSAQTANITAASNGTGTYTYTEKSEKNSAGTATNYISISGTTINIAASTPAGTYTYVITAKDSGSNVTKDATYTIKINPIPTTNTVTITGTPTFGQTLTANVETSSDGTKHYQWYYATSKNATSGTNITDATNATYTIANVGSTSMVGKYIGCKVTIDAGTNWNAHTGATATTQTAVAKATPTLTLGANGAVDYNATKNFSVKASVAGSIVVTSKDTTCVTVTANANTTLVANTAKNVTIKGIKAKDTATNVEVVFTPTDSANYNSVTKNYSVTKVNKLTVGAPSNVAVSTAGIVTWTAGSNANAHEISIDNSTWTTATSGVNYLSTIIGGTGTRTVYVRAKNTDTTNYTSPSSNATKDVTVYAVTLASNSTTMGTVSPTTYNVISGATYTTSSNTLTIKGVTSGTTTADLKTITASPKTGYSFSSWSSTSGTINANTTLTATFAENTYTIAFNNNTGSGTMSSITGVKYTESKTLTTNTFTKTGYTFNGWNTKANGTGTSYTNGQSVSKLSATNGATVTLYAQWTANQYKLVKVSNNNLVKNGDFETYTIVNAPSKTANGATHTWDKNLNGIPGNTSKAYSATSWGTGANMGVAIPEIGYHGHMKLVNNNALFSFKTNEDYAGKTKADLPDGITVGGDSGIATNRWLGISQSIPGTNLIAGNTYAMTVDIYRVSGSNRVTGGLLYKTTSNTTKGFQSGQCNLAPSTSGQWETLTWTFTLASDYINTDNPSIYIYGNTGGAGELYVDNVRLEDVTILDKNYDTAYTTAELATLTRTGYTFNGWYNNASLTTNLTTSSTFNNTTATFQNINTAGTIAKIYAKWTANPLTFANQTITKNYSTSQQTASITAASNGTGTYTYTEKSEKNSAGTATNYISISGTTINIAASTPAGTYTYVITATDSNSNVTKDATYTIKINPIPTTNTVTITGTPTFGQTLTANVETNSDGTKHYQWYYATSKNATSGTNITNATNATYTIANVGSTSMVGKYIGCKVTIDAGTNWNANTGATATTQSAVIKATPTITFNPTATSAEINYNESKTFKAKSNVAGTLSATSASSTYVSITGGASNNATANTEYTITYKGARYRASATNITVKIVPTDTANWNEATKTFSVTKVNKLTVGAPSGLTVSTAGIVTWTAGTNSNAHEISIDNSTWTTATSGVNYLSTITAATGSRTVYVRAKNTDTTNYTTPSSNATKAVTVRTLTTSSNNTNYGTVDSSTYNVISGVTYTTSNNTLAVKSGTTTLKTITASPKTGHSFSSWSSASGTISANTTVTATFTVNTYTIKFNGNGATSGSMSNLSMTYGTAKNLTANAFKKEGKGFAGWATSATATDATYTDGQEVNNLTTTNGATVNLYAVWADAELLSGSDFSRKIKQLAGHSGTSINNDPIDTNITEFRKSEIKPTAENMTSNNLISLNTSKVPVYAWFDNGTIYWWSEDATPLCNTNSAKMFYRCQGLTSLDLSGFNTEQVTNMNAMFSNCSSLTSLNVSSFNTSNVKSMQYMFSYCSSLTSLDLSGFNTNQVWTMSSMFNDCSSLTNIDLSSFNTANVENMEFMFSNCSSLTSINVSNFNTAKVTNMRYMFRNCSSLTSLDLSSFNTAQVTDMSFMFSECYSLTSLNLSNFNTTQVINMRNMFSRCRALTSLNISSFNTAKVTNMNGMFAECYSLTNLNLSNFNTAQVNDMQNMFGSCGSLTSLNISSFNTANVTNMNYMFLMCSSLTSLDLSSFNTAQVTTMSSMFDGCDSLISLDLSSFNTAQVTNMSSMILSCDALTTIYATDNFVTTNVTSSSRMFESDTNLVGGNGTVYNSSYNDKTYACIDRPGTPGYFTGRFTITLDSSGATTAGTQTIYETQGEKYSLTLTGDAITSITKPAKTGYNFIGYYTEANGAGTKCIDSNGKIIVGNRQFTANTTLYAYFAKTYTIRFNGNDSTSGSMSDLTMICGTAKNLTANAFKKEGKGFAGWATSATATTATYTDGQEVNNLTTTNGATVNLYAVWADAELLAGSNFNIKIKTLAGNTGTVTYSTDNTTITQFKKSETKPTAENMTSNNLISLSTSKVPVYAWFDNGTIYWWSEDATPLCNASSSHMFECCKSLTSLDLSSFNTAKVTSMQSMFDKCSSLTSINLSNFNTAQVTTMSSMFSGCSGLTSLNVSSFNTAKVTNMSYMFYRCSSLTSLDLSSFNTAKVTDMGSMFDSCSSLTSLDVSNFNTSNVRSMSGMFSGCDGLTSLDLSSFNIANVTNMRSMFYRCSSLTSLDLSSFNTAKVTDMGSMFDSCSSLTSLDLSSFNTSNVTSMNSMFSSCSSLTSLDLSSFNTANVTNMRSMFYRCSSLTSIDLSSFNTANVTGMYCMFFSCSGLTSLDVSSFSTANVTSMYEMFYSCSNLTTIYATEDFVTTNVTIDTGVFSKDTKLVGGNGTVFNSSHVDKEYARIDRSGTPGYFTLKGVHKITLNNQSATSAGTQAIYETYGSQYSLSHGGSATTTITKPTRTGYTFGGYYSATNGGGTQYINASGTITASNTTFTGATTIYAKWTANTYTLSYDSNMYYANNASSSGLSVSYSPLTSILTLNGTSTATGTGIALFRYPGLTFTANDKYTMTLTYQSGSYSSTASSPAADVVVDIQTNSNANVSTRNATAPVLPTSGSTTATLTVNSAGASEGKQFYYWLWFREGQNKYSFNNYKVRVDFTKVQSKSVTYGSQYGTLITPTKLGYTFDGWYTGFNGGGTKITSSTNVTTASNHTLYAKWKVNAITNASFTSSLTISKGKTANTSLKYSGVAKTVAYTTSNSTVATVNSSGVVTAASNKTGTATITVTITDYNGTATKKTCAVTVK